MPRPLLIFAFTVAILQPLCLVQADDDLEKRLLGDLESELLDDLERPKAKPADDKGKPSDKPLRQVGEGEDIPLGEQDPLSKIARQMRLVEELIGEANTAEQTQRAQKEIVDDLAAMIEQLKKQQNQQRPNQGQGNRPGGKPTPGSSSAGKANKPASESSNRLGKSERSKIDEEALRTLIKEVWGHLPARIRDRIQTPTVDKFLPKYEKLIEDYFRRLAEDGSP